MSDDVRWLPAGPEAVLLELGSTERVVEVYAGLLAQAELLAVDVVPAARTILFDGVRDRGRLERAVAQALADESDAEAARRTGAAGEVEVPVRYDGHDLDEVGRLWAMTRAEVVATHTGTVFTVAFCGFAPGFAYCTGLPAELHVPRRDSPRTRVPAGAVGLAGEFTGVYPRSSPGGWQLLGTTDLDLWDLGSEPPARLSPGTRVRFTEAR